MLINTQIMKGFWQVIIGVIVLVLLFFVLTAGDDSAVDLELGENEGRVFFSVTDDTADISSVNEIELEIEEIEVYSQAEGWTRVSGDSKTYALLELKANGTVELYDARAVTAGAYDRVRVTFGDVTVDHQTEGRVQAFLPSEQVTFDVAVAVEEGNDSHVTLDFLADQSLHTTTTEGEFVFAPVVTIESRSGATVDVGDDNSVSVSGGTVDAQTTIGVDLEGNARAGFRLDSSAGLEINSSVTDGVQFMLGGETFMQGGASNESSEDDEEDEDTTSAETSSETEVNAGDSDASVETETGVEINY